MKSFCTDMINKLSTADRAWFCGVTLFVLIFSTIPHIAGFTAQNSEMVFNGSPFYVPDYAAHMAAMHIGYRGEWKFHLLFSPEDQTGAYIKLPYIFLGHLSKWTGLSFHTTFQVARITMSLFACLTIYWLIVQTFPDSASRNLSYLLALMGSGLGWLQWLIGWIPVSRIDPIDFWNNDPYIYSSLMHFPHNAAEIVFLIGMIAAYISYQNNPRLWKLFCIAGCGLLLQLMVPFAPLLGFIVIGALFLSQAIKTKRLPWKELGYLAAVGAVQLPLLFHNYNVFRSDPVFQNWASQNLTLTPPLIYYLFGFGLFWPIVIYGILRRKVFQNPILTAMVVWLVSALILAYMPWQFQRRMMFAYSLPMAILFIFTIKTHIEPWFDSKSPPFLAKRKISILLFVLPFFMLSPIYLTLGKAMFVHQRPATHFYPSPLVEAIDWLDMNSDWNEVLLSSPQSGQLAVARIGKKVFIGHEMETVHYQDKLQQVESLFDGALSAAELSPSNVVWILYGPYEKEMGMGFSPDSNIEIAFQNQEVTIYKVIQSP